MKQTLTFHFIRNTILTLASSQTLLTEHSMFDGIPQGSSEILVHVGKITSQLLQICLLYLCYESPFPSHLKRVLVASDLMTRKAIVVHRAHRHIHGTSLKLLALCGMAHYHGGDKL